MEDRDESLARIEVLEQAERSLRNTALMLIERVERLERQARQQLPRGIGVIAGDIKLVKAFPLTAKDFRGTSERHLDIDPFRKILD